MRALSLWQPWASLVAEGVKTIETRSWSTAYRGPLAIHAAKRPPGALSLGVWNVRRLDVGAPRRMFRTDRHDSLIDLPLGAVVATCALVDVVPIIDGEAAERDDLADLPYPRVESLVGSGEFPDGWLDLWHPTLGNPIDPDSGRSVPEEAPYGDFTPGRYAWLLADIVKLDEPVPARGRQQLWNWDEQAVVA